MPDASRDWKALVRARLASLPLDPARASDVVDELAQHVAEHHAELTASGMDDLAALDVALRPLAEGDRVALEIARADRPRRVAPVPPPAGPGGLVRDCFRDVRYALRLLARGPGFAVVAIVTLALGIGANTTIFSALNAVLLRPLPFADPDRLVTIGERQPNGSAGNLGYMTFVDWRDRSRGFDGMALIRNFTPTLALDGQPERVAGMRVSWNYFQLLGVRPALGRDFREADDNPASWRVVLITDAFWRRRFGADPRVVGRVVSTGDQPFTIVGVLPASYEPIVSEHFYQRADLVAPLGYDASLSYACRDCEHLKAIGRLGPGVALEAARAGIDAVQQALRAQYPTSYSESTMTLVRLADELNGDIRPVLLVLMGAVALVLLIACANVANLLLARGADRAHDLALRTALGASRARLIRQMLVESGVIGLAGGALGLLIAAWGVPLLTRLSPMVIPRLDDARVDGRVLVFSLAVSVATALVFGLLPALRVSRVDAQTALHAGRSRTTTGAGSIARRLLVAADVALAVVLLAGAGLMIRSVVGLLAVDPGFDPSHALTLQVSLVGKSYAEDAATVRAVDRMVAQLRGLPGVHVVAAASQVPLGGNYDHYSVHVEGRTAPNPVDDPSAERYAVTPDYFAAMRIPLERGRLFTDADREGAARVLIVGERTAATLWPHGDAVGRHVKIGGLDGPWMTVVGVVGDVRHKELAAPPELQMYVAEAQTADSYLTVVIRADGDPSLVAAEARRAIRTAASDVPVYQIAPFADLVEQSLGTRRFVMILLELFGAIAVILTTIGLYGVLAYSVAERTREIGIRAALGATRASIVRLVIGDGLTVVGAGLGIGVVAAAAATRYLRSGLYGVGPTDPATFGGVLALLVVVAALAHAVPVLRATRVDPTVALRQD